MMVRCALHCASRSDTAAFCLTSARAGLPGHSHQLPSLHPAAMPQFLIAIDIVLNFHVARYKDGQLLTDKRELAIDYLR